MLKLETKECPRCHVDKYIDDFNWKVKGKRRQVHCKRCQSDLTKDHYRRNKSKYILRALKRNRIVSDRNRSLAADYMMKHPCVDCGERDIVVLEFDHRDKTKEHTIGCILGHARWEDIEAEIAKCDVRCANCHKRRHAKEDKTFKFRFMSRKV